MIQLKAACLVLQFKKIIMAENNTERQSKINIAVTLDEKLIPEKIMWDATDSSIAGWKECRAMLLSMWDHKATSGLSIELWTKEMTVEEMNLFFFQTLMTLSDTFERATMNKESAADMKAFAKNFLEKIKAKEKKEAV